MVLVAVASTNKSCGTSASGNSSDISMNRSSNYGGNTTSNLGTRWCWGRRGQQSMEYICCRGNNNNHGDRNISVMLVLVAVTVVAIEIW